MNKSALIVLAAGLLSPGLSINAAAQSAPPYWGNDDSRPIPPWERRRLGAYTELFRAKPGYQQRFEALEDRGPMLAEEGPPVPTYDPRTHTLFGGKLLPNVRTPSAQELRDGKK